MKKYTCKLIPKNENAEAIEYDIELNETNRKPDVWKFIVSGVIGAFCFGMTIALLVWSSIVNKTPAFVDQFFAILFTMGGLIVVSLVCGAAVVISLFKAPKTNAVEEKIIERVVDTVADDCEKDSAAANEGKKKKGFQIKVTRL